MAKAKRKPAAPNGVVLWRGPSLLDGAPLVVIATGTRSKSANGKTGAMIQTWVMREDINPMLALHTGKDSSICGNCKLRPYPNGKAHKKAKPEGPCYVRVYQAPLAVWRAYHRGIYPIASRADLRAIGRGRMVRIGSYGDGAAVPVYVWRELIAEASGHTAYTHQWRTAPDLRAIAMASTDTPDEREQARALGWRTFTVRLQSDPLAVRESVCPASKEANYKTDCATCGACNGAASGRHGSIAIIAHGALAGRYIALRRAA